MQYTLITKQNKIRQFYVQATAELYQIIEGGVVVASAMLDAATEVVLEADHRIRKLLVSWRAQAQIQSGLVL